MKVCKLHKKQIVKTECSVSPETLTHSYSSPFFPFVLRRLLYLLHLFTGPLHFLYPSLRPATQNTPTTKRRALSVSASKSTTLWPVTAGSSALQRGPTASPAPWGKWTLTPSSPPPRWSRWTRSTSRPAPGFSVLPGLLILTGRKVWSWAVLSSPSARRKVRKQQSLLICGLRGFLLEQSAIC